jgi:hypothetical protein
MTNRARAIAATSIAGLTLSLGLTFAPGVTAQAASPTDAFYSYTGSTPLAQLTPGTVLKTRTIPYSIQGLALPIKAVQVLYRTRDQQGRAVVNATTVVRPLITLGKANVVSYQSFYDSLNPADEPSVAIAGGQGIGPAFANIETALFSPLLLAGFTINIPDTEGQTADFAAGREYGYTTLDSLRAIGRASATGVSATSKTALIGYSGGAIASEWAAELAPTYSPDVAANLVGTAIGGVLVAPGHNLHYVDGSSLWAGVMPMAIVGIARAAGADLTPYLSDYGKQVYAEMQTKTIAQVLGAYPGLTWKQLAKPEYDVPEKVGLFLQLANDLIMTTGGTPNAPLFVGQGTGGELEGTPASATYGKGDGVMIAGDVRTLARTYCDRGVRVQYREYATSHFTSIAPWLPEALAWTTARFTGLTAPSSCGSIAVGNSLAPQVALN